MKKQEITSASPVKIKSAFPTNPQYQDNLKNDKFGYESEGNLARRMELLNAITDARRVYDQRPRILPKSKHFKEATTAYRRFQTRMYQLEEEGM